MNGQISGAAWAGAIGQDYSNRAKDPGVGGQMAYDRAATLGLGAETRQAEIPSQMGRLEQMLKGCLQGLETLGSRLESTVMRPQPPTSVGCDAKPCVAPNTPYGSRLQELTSMAEMVNERIQSLTARLEV